MFDIPNFANSFQRGFVSYSFHPLYPVPFYLILEYLAKQEAPLDFIDKIITKISRCCLYLIHWILCRHCITMPRYKRDPKKIANAAENILGENVQAICFLGPDLPVRRPISCWERAACISPGDAYFKPALRPALRCGNGYIFRET